VVANTMRKKKDGSKRQRPREAWRLEYAVLIDAAFSVQRMLGATTGGELRRQPSSQDTW
jgi:hypothetical protein